MSRWRELLGHGLVWLSGLYGLVLSVILLLNLFLTEANAFVGLARSFLSILLMPALLLLPLTLLLRRWIAGALLVPAAVGFFAYYGVFLLPRSEPAPADVAHVRILTFNLQFPQTKLESLGEIITSVDADFVALQELSPEAAAYFEQEFGQEYPYQALHPKADNHAGQGLLSRHPIRADEYWRFDELEATLGHQRVELDVDGVGLTIFNVHPVPPYAPERGFNAQPHTREVRRLLRRAADVTGPVMLVGDFNMSDQFEDYDNVTETYRDAYREVGEIGLGFSYPNGRRLPLPAVIRLDYIFYNEQIVGIEARTVNQSGSSDHRPVTFEFYIR